MDEPKTGDKVSWKWGSGTGKGKVAKLFKTDTTETIKGKTIKRKASAEKPAAEVTTDKGAKVLKSASELKKIK